MIRTRSAPSPTGLMHIGNLRTAAYSFALAKHNKGQFLVRIEDTDQKREMAGAREKLLETFKLFHLYWDEEPVIQSQRAKTDVYKKAAEKLVSSGYAYQEDSAVRLKVPKDETISFHDFVIRKDISWDSKQIPDAVLLKSDGFPTYHLASVVDDNASKITHVIRSVEWLPSTPIHLLLYQFLGYDKPEIGHPTAVLDPEGGKLSKRKGNVSVEQFLQQGYLPEAILNFVILLGWAPKDNRELFTLDEFVKYFDPHGFQKSNPVFNQKKLDWFNGHYIRQKSDAELLQLIKPYLPEITPEIIPLIKDRIITLADAKSLARFFFIRPIPSYPTDKSYLESALEVLSDISWTKKAIEEVLLNKIKDQDWKTGDFFMSLRLAICGSKITPPLTESMLILGKDETLARIRLRKT